MMYRTNKLSLTLLMFCLVGGLLSISEAGPIQPRGQLIDPARVQSSGIPGPLTGDADLDGGEDDGDRGIGDDDAPGETVRLESVMGRGSSGVKQAFGVMFQYAMWFIVY